LPGGFRFFFLLRRVGFALVCGEAPRSEVNLRQENDLATKKAAGGGGGGSKKTLSKSGLIQAITEAAGEELSRKQVKHVLESLASVGYRELKKAGIFTRPGFAKFRVVKKPATKARQGINPFTKQPQTFAAKPASKSVRARPIKAIKDALA
jgi:DNA-binding protein HU-beta